MSGRFEGLSIALHTAGTVALGAGIALAGQIFNLEEHWPAGIMLWAAGAALAWALLRHWTQAALTAILVPYWLAGEWWVRAQEMESHPFIPIAAGICALSLTYLSARRASNDSLLRKAMGWLGGIALLPAALVTAISEPGWNGAALAWLVAVIGPLALAWMLRGRAAIWNLAAAGWVLLLAASAHGWNHDNVLVYVWCAAGAVGMTFWGVAESRAERINLGSAGFALTVLCFYFSSVMDKLGRSASLMLLGVLFLGGGWLLERMRRKLIAQIRPEAV